MPTVCLTMIVKNEAAVLARCLASVRPLLDAWCIVDTGSTDETRAVAERSLAGLPGAFHERPWRDFAHNRSEAFTLARASADYHLVIDADDALAFEADYRFPALNHDAYRVPIRYGELTYERLHLFRSALPWRYEGVLHEYPTCDPPHTEALLSGITYVVHPDGARSRDPKKFEKDAALLEAALRDEPKHPRYTFYLAQSYRDAGQLEEAIAAYERRVALGGWEEEVYVSLLHVARLRLRRGEGRATVREAFLRAYNYRPTRAEALVDLAAYCRGAHEWPLAFLFAEMASRLPRPQDLLFVEDAAYQWRALDELAVAAFYFDKRALATTLNRRLLSEGHVPVGERPRIEKNLSFGE